MHWNISRFLQDRSGGVIAKLAIDKGDYDTLVHSRKRIRAEIRHVFSRIRQALESNSKERILKDVLPTHIAEAILAMSPEQLHILSKLKPVFFTQGSFQYGTLNRPAYPPKQQLDLDDGVYLPIEFFEQSPILGKEVFIQIIDFTLEQLCRNNSSWEGPFYKSTCARINVAPHIHIDVPLYAIPEDEYENLEKSTQRNQMILDSLSSSVGADPYDDFYSKFLTNIEYSKNYLAPDKIYLAIRDGQEHWMPSDPALVARWFESAAKTHGAKLVNTCRYLKAWRDSEFIEGGPSSLTLMACAVETFDNSVNSDDWNEQQALLISAEALSSQLKEGVVSPDPSDDRLLFPKGGMNPNEITEIIQKAIGLASALKDSTCTAHDKDSSKAFIVDGIGVHARTVSRELIVPQQYDDVMKTPITKKEPRVVPNLRSGVK